MKIAIAAAVLLLAGCAGAPQKPKPDHVGHDPQFKGIPACHEVTLTSDPERLKLPGYAKECVVRK